MTFRLRKRLPLLVASITVALTQTAQAAPANYFERIATLPVYENLDPSRGDTSSDTTVAEIMAASTDGMTLYYTDSPGERLGIVNLQDPAQPKAAGYVTLEGEPTSVAVKGNYVLVAVNTSESFTQPSGVVAVFDASQPLQLTRVATLDVHGQPDSIAISPDGRYAAVVVENERDEDENDGLIPQQPSGHLTIIDMPARLAAWKTRTVALTGLAEIAPEDAEPEYVSINNANIAAITLQENNHIVQVNLRTGKVVNHFSAGTVDLHDIDTVEDDVIQPVDSLFGVRREPDAITWVGPYMATANEGDYEDANGVIGGSRGFTLFNRQGKVAFDIGSAFEHDVIRHGHYPESRSENKGVEPEGIAQGRYGQDQFLFVGAERANIVGVYALDNYKRPTLHQMLPTNIAPEGLLAIPQRNLFIASTEADDAGDGIRSAINVFRLGAMAPFYPQVKSADDALIPWGTLSGMVADGRADNTLYAVPDSYYQQSRIFRINAAQTPAVIEAAIPLLKQGASVSYDLEGIAQSADGSFWLASEGDAKKTANLLIKADANGNVLAEYALPEAISAQQKSNGFEGVTVIGSGENERIVVAFQREWKDDATGLVRIGFFKPADQSWQFVHYPLDVAATDTWNGLSEITALDDSNFVVIERDNQGGPAAKNKKLYRFSIDGKAPVTHGETYPVVSKQLVRDLLPDLQATQGWVVDKAEGTAITRDGQVFVVTDNDGIDDATGETRFLRLGKLFD